MNSKTCDNRQSAIWKEKKKSGHQRDNNGLWDNSEKICCIHTYNIIMKCILSIINIYYNKKKKDKRKRKTKSVYITQNHLCWEFLPQNIYMIRKTLEDCQAVKMDKMLVKCPTQKPLTPFLYMVNLINSCCQEWDAHEP